jgi:hypothetical protein
LAIRVRAERVMTATNERADGVDPAFVLATQKRTGDALFQVVDVDGAFLDTARRSISGPRGESLRLSIDCLRQLAALASGQAAEVLGDSLGFDRCEWDELMTARGAAAPASWPILGLRLGAGYR